MPSQDFGGRKFRHEPTANLNGTYEGDAAQRADHQDHDHQDDDDQEDAFRDGLRQRLRRDRGPGEDLFLSLALNESDLNGNKRQSLPARATLNQLRSPATERPRSSGNVPGSSPNESFPVLDEFQRTLSRRNSPLYPREGNHTAREQGRGTTPTPSRYASRSSHYLSDHHDYSSPDTQHWRGGRQASSSFSETISRQRLQRVGAYDNTLKEGRNTLDQEASMPTPNTPVGNRRSDPETESAGSVTAPSTVWDELDELKSRIRHLEITGRTPSTSAAAMINHAGERPRTATTAPTTVSSSPKQVRKNSIAPSEVTVGGPSAANIHPLLHNAMAKAKPLLSPSLYRALEATAADALALAAMTGSTGPQGTAYSAASIVNGVNPSDRHIRRKADSMCRNVTDLCIALSEGKSQLPSPGYKVSPATTTFRFQGNTPPSHYAHRGGAEQEDRTLRSSPSRAFSRIDTRRSSLLSLGLGSSNGNSPRDTVEQYTSQEPSPSQGHVDYAARYNRPGTSFLRSRFSGAEEQSDEPTFRAPSRAMTEVGHRRQRLSDGAPGVQPRSPGLRESLVTRRTTLGIPEERDAEQLESPSDSTYQEGDRGVLDRHRPPPSETGSLIPNKRRRRITSLEQYASPVPRIGSEPMRSASISRRRNVLGQ